MSQRQAARKYNISQRRVGQILQKNGVCARKKMRIPSRTEQQKTVARAKCGNLYLKNQGFPNPEKLDMVITPLFLNINKKKSIGFKANFI